MQKEDKERVVADLTERLRQAETLFVADYRGLTMPQIDALRGRLLESGARLSVVKNTLTRRAAEAAGADALLALLEGPSAIAFIEADGDMVAVAKALADSARETKVLEIRGGVMQGREISAASVEELAKLPPIDILRGQVLAAIVAPLTAIMGLLTAPLQNLHGLIDARIEQLGGADAAPAAEEPASEEAPPEPESAPEEPTAVEAGQEPDGRADDQRDADRDDPDLQRHPRPVDDPRGGVAAQLVRPHQVDPARRQEAAARLGGRVVRRQQRGGERDGDRQQHDRRADDPDRVAPLARQAAPSPRGGEAGLASRDGQARTRHWAAHPCLIRGSR